MTWKPPGVTGVGALATSTRTVVHVALFYLDWLMRVRSWLDSRDGS